jgi:hypothetical protein
MPEILILRHYLYFIITKLPALRQWEVGQLVLACEEHGCTPDTLPLYDHQELAADERFLITIEAYTKG